MSPRLCGRTRERSSFRPHRRFALSSTAGARRHSFHVEPYNTWVNPSYELYTTKSVRIVYNRNGTWIAFDSFRSTVPSHCGTITIWDQWTDDQGNHWYKVTCNRQGMKVFVYELWKINKAGFVLESVWSVEAMPSHLDPEDPSYTIYFREAKENEGATPVPRSPAAKPKVDNTI